MKWYWIVLLVMLAFATGYGWHWYNSPLGCPLCLCDKGAMALPNDYTQYWEYIKIAAVAGILMIVVLAGELLAILRQVQELREQLCSR